MSSAPIMRTTLKNHNSCNRQCAATQSTVAKLKALPVIRTSIANIVVTACLVSIFIKISHIKTERVDALYKPHTSTALGTLQMNVIEITTPYHIPKFEGRIGQVV